MLCIKYSLTVYSEDFLFCQAEKLLLQQLIDADQFDTEYENLCCNSQFFHCREGWGNSNIAVFRIFSVRERRSGSGHDQTSFLRLR